MLPLLRAWRDHRCRCFAFFQKLFELDHELADVLEGAIDGSESNVSNLIRVMQFPHGGFPDHRAGNLFVAPLLEAALDSVRDRLNGIDAYRPFFTGALKTINDLEAIITLPPAVLLYNQRHHLFDTLVGGETPAALRTLPAAADHAVIFTQPGIDYAVIGLMAEGTFHWIAYSRVDSLELATLQQLPVGH